MDYTNKSKEELISLARFKAAKVYSAVSGAPAKKNPGFT